MAVQLIATRRSVRRYVQQEIAPELLNELLQCAVHAPSAHNRQPWRFTVIRNTDLKVALGRAMGERLRNDRLRDGDALEAVKVDVERSIERIATAPAVVLVALTMSDMDAYPDKIRGDAEYLMAVQSTAMAVQNLLLAAHAAGLGACWMCGPLFCADTVRETLSLPEDWQPQAIITLGVPGMPGKIQPRRPLSDVTRCMEPA